MRSVLVLIGCGAIVLGLGIALRVGPGRADRALERASEADVVRASPSRTSVSLEAPDVPAARETLQTVDPPGASTRVTNACSLRIRAVDALTGAELDGVRVRAASATRIADRPAEPGRGELLLKLTPGEYALLCFARGYEPLELPALRLAPSESRALDPLYMREGSARVLGLVRGELPPEPGLRAELFGEGRRPCALCMDVPTSAPSTLADRDAAWQRSEPCPNCGYAARSTRHPVDPDGRFGFDRLVSGAYTLRLLDARERPIGLPQSFELRAAEVLALQCEAPPLRSIEVEFLDVDGTSLAPRWAAILRAQEQEGEQELDIVEGESNDQPVAVKAVFRAGELPVGSSTFLTPIPPGRAGTSIGVGSGFRGRRMGGGSRESVDDRARTSSDVLRPPQRAPVLEPVAVAAQVLADGGVRYSPLPAVALALELSSGPFRAKVMIPPVRLPARLQAQWTREGAGTFRQFAEDGRGGGR
jgi:hypothetical protein